MYRLTQQEALNAQNDLMSKFNPSNPEHVKKLKSLTEHGSGGTTTIITEGEMAGKGLYPLSGNFFGGRGFGFTETEKAKRERERESKFGAGNANSAEVKFGPNNANSPETKRRLIAEQNKTKEREWQLKKYGHSKI
jgi:hypothetical protein